MATAPAAEGGCAALLGAPPLVARLLDQLAAHGAPEAVVVTRPAWEADVRRAVGERAHVRVSADLAGDLRLLAGLAADGAGPLVLACGELAMHG
jgi:hypothetical protein